MLTCGHYDGSGDFAYRVGLPGKSGVGGGILAIAPGPRRRSPSGRRGSNADRQLAARRRRARAARPAHRLVGVRRLSGSAALADRADDGEQHHRADDRDHQRADEAGRRQPEQPEQERARGRRRSRRPRGWSISPWLAAHHLLGDPAGDQPDDQKAQPAQSAHARPPLPAPACCDAGASSRFRRSRAEPHHLPRRARRGARPAEAVVQPVRAVGPELDLDRDDPVAAPERRPRRVEALAAPSPSPPRPSAPRGSRAAATAREAQAPSRLGRLRER